MLTNTKSKRSDQGDNEISQFPVAQRATGSKVQSAKSIFKQPLYKARVILFRICLDFWRFQKYLKVFTVIRLVFCDYFVHDGKSKHYKGKKFQISCDASIFCSSLSKSKSDFTKPNYCWQI